MVDIYLESEKLIHYNIKSNRNKHIGIKYLLYYQDQFQNIQPWKNLV